MLYEYVATYGDKYKIDSFKGHRELRKDHLELLNGKVYYNSENSLRIETTLLYEVGQFVSIGGYPYGGRKIKLLKVLINGKPILNKTKKILKKGKNDNLKIYNF